MSDKIEGFIGGVLCFIIVIALILLFVGVHQKGIVNSCELSGSFIAYGKSYKCELMK
jgi:CDP-diglyceride synthetase